MTPNGPRQLSPGQLRAGLTDLLGSKVPDYEDLVLRQVARTRQRPRWSFVERWLPMSVITRPPCPRPMSTAWMLLLVALLAAALVTSFVIVGSVLRRDQGPDGLNSGLVAPTLTLDSTWDQASIPGLSVPAGLDVGP